MPHTDPKVCMTVQLWIVHEDRVLLRLHDKVGEWLGVGGHIDPGEDPLQAAHREALEEVGLIVKIPGEPEYAHGDGFTEFPMPIAVNRHRIDDTHDHVALEYAAISDTDEIVQPNNHERTECRWCTRDELESMELYPSVKRYALAALDVLDR